MSKQDTHFFNVFSVVLGLLVAFAILVFALARYVGKEQNASVQQDPLLQQTVAERVSGAARVAVAGQDNAALKIAPVTQVASAAATVVLETGEQVYKHACIHCHNPAVAAALSAPPLGDKGAWGPRAAKGKPTLYEHAINGFEGKGKMPAKGGFTNLSDDQVKMAVDHMLEQL